MMICQNSVFSLGGITTSMMAVYHQESLYYDYTLQVAESDHLLSSSQLLGKKSLLMETSGASLANRPVGCGTFWGFIPSN